MARRCGSRGPCRRIFCGGFAGIVPGVRTSGGSRPGAGAQSATRGTGGKREQEGRCEGQAPRADPGHRRTCRAPVGEAQRPPDTWRGRPFRQAAGAAVEEERADCRVQLAVRQRDPRRERPPPPGGTPVRRRLPGEAPAHVVGCTAGGRLRTGRSDEGAGPAERSAPDHRQAQRAETPAAWCPRREARTARAGPEPGAAGAVAVRPQPRSLPDRDERRPGPRCPAHVHSRPAPRHRRRAPRAADPLARP